MYNDIFTLRLLKVANLRIWIRKFCGYRLGNLDATLKKPSQRISASEQRAILIIEALRNIIVAAYSILKTEKKCISL